MKIDFTVNTENPYVVWAIKDALERAGFRVRNCGVMLATNEPDIECDPPIDFVDSVPDPLAGFVIPPGGSVTLNMPAGIQIIKPKWWQFWK